MARSFGPLWARVLVALSVASFLAGCLAHWPFVADDAFIVGRYALNAVEGNGLVYNLGERVSALTSPLHALLEVLLALVTDDPVGLYRLIAPALPIVGWLAAVRIARPRGAELALFSAVALSSPFLALWTVGGLETPILTMLLAVFAAVLVRIARAGAAGGRDFLALGVVAGLAFLTRFDSVLITLPPMLALVRHCRRDWRLWASAGVSLAIALSWLGFAQAYYGTLLPSSAFVKLGGAGSETRITGAFAVLNFLVLSGAAFLLPAVRLGADLRPLSGAVVTGAVYAATLFGTYAVFASAQHMMFGYRLFVPLLPAIGLGLAFGVRRWRAPIAAALLAGQAAISVYVATVGINPFPVPRLLGVDYPKPEMRGVTPREQGRLMQVLEEDARDLRADWAERALEPPARIFLYTGGMGYWLPDFYVYEVLISYRRHCSSEVVRKQFWAVHYVQDFSVIALNEAIQAEVRTRPDVGENPVVLSETTIDFGGVRRIAYVFGPDPKPLVLPSRTTDPC